MSKNKVLTKTKNRTMMHKMIKQMNKRLGFTFKKAPGTGRKK